MDKKGLERRICERFKIPGATVSIKKKKLLFPEKEYDENRHPVVEFSRGGIRFLAKSSIKLNSNRSIYCFRNFKHINLFKYHTENKIPAINAP